jgi:hypothetical protein
MVNFLLLLFENNFNTDIFKVYCIVFMFSILVLCLFFIRFEDTEKIQNLNLFFLHLNLVLFVLFFYFGFNFFILKIDILITYHKTSIIIFMYLLSIFSFLCLKPKKQVSLQDELFYKENKYIHRSNLLLFSKLDPSYNLAVEISYGFLFLVVLIHVIKENIEVHFMLTYLFILLNILQFILVLIYTLLFIIFMSYFIPFLCKRYKV